MKSVYALIFIATILVLLVCIKKASKNNKVIAKAIEKLMIVAAISVSIHIGLLYSTSTLLSTWLYGLFYASMDWLLYYLLKFTMEFVGNRMEDYVKIPLMQLLLLFDSVATILGGFFGYSYVCVERQMADGSIYIGAKHFAPYNFHLFVSYMLLVFTLCCLVYKTIKVPPFYRRKYLSIIGILLLIALGDALYMMQSENIDISIIGFALGGVLMYYYALSYAPDALVEKTYAMIVRDMDAAIFLLDAEGAFVRANESAYEMIEITDEFQNVKQKFSSWLEAEKWKESDGKVWEWSEENADGKHYYSARFQSLFDKKKCYIGGFFMVRDCTKEKELLKKEHYRATHDQLTGIYNRECFFERAAECLHENPEEEYVLLCSDIKDFKFINDVFGTEAGDQILKRIADLIVRDTKPGEIYGRLENDRFGILIKKKDYREDLFDRDPKKVVHVEQGNMYRVNIYVGVYEVKNKSIPVSIMCDRASMAIKSIKGNYQQKVAYYDDALRDSVLREQELTSELQTALNEGQFRIYLQPQTEKSGNVPGAEALVRWLHPIKGMIMPGEFIEIFEENGMIVKLDQYIWEQACIQLKKWKEQGREDMYISVNISPKDFYLTDIYKTLTGLIEKYEINPRNLKLEITETAMIMNLERQLELIENLRNAGFVVEMDDFGSGYSSLNMLKDIKVDVLKIDMAFLRHSDDEMRSRKILKTMVELSNELGMPAITEGVETEEQVQFLTEIGCELFQGYYFAKPMPISEFEKKYM